MNIKDSVALAANGLRNELRAQGTHVVGLHAAFIDTGMVRGIEAPNSPEAVVLQVLAAIEEGPEEVLTDEVTRNAKRGLGAERALPLNRKDIGVIAAAGLVFALITI